MTSAITPSNNPPVPSSPGSSPQIGTPPKTLPPRRQIKKRFTEAAVTLMEGLFSLSLFLALSLVLGLVAHNLIGAITTGLLLPMTSSVWFILVGIMSLKENGNRWRREYAVSSHPPSPQAKEMEMKVREKMKEAQKKKVREERLMLSYHDDSKGR